MATERLSSLDASFLYLETPALHMHVAGLSIFAPRKDGPLTYDHVQRVVEARIHLAPRLRQRVLPVPGNLGRPVWWTTIGSTWISISVVRPCRPRVAVSSW